MDKPRNKPIANVSFRHRDGGVTLGRIGTVWESPKGYLSLSLGFWKKDVDADPAVKIVLASGREVVLDQYYLNVYLKDGLQLANAPSPERSAPPNPFADGDDIPF